MIVSFNLNRNCEAFAKVNYSCVIFKNRETPRRLELLRNLGNISLEEALDFLFANKYFTLEGLVKAMLRPRLPNSLKLNICRISVFLAEVFLNLLHFLQV